MTERGATCMWVSMQVSIHVEHIFGGEGLSEALYPQIWSKFIFKFKHCWNAALFNF